MSMMVFQNYNSDKDPIKMVAKVEVGEVFYTNRDDGIYSFFMRTEDLHKNTMQQYIGNPETNEGHPTGRVGRVSVSAIDLITGKNETFPAMWDVAVIGKFAEDDYTESDFAMRVEIV